MTLTLKERLCAALDAEHFRHFGFANLKINGAMNVEAIATARLGDGNFGVLGAGRVESFSQNDDVGFVSQIEFWQAAPTRA
jgi:hypothetical protein